MESEKVKEIKKALECCQGESLKSCEHCPYWNWCKEDDGLTFKSDILTLINELESENKKLKQHKRELEGGQQDLVKLVKRLNNDIAELEKENKELLKENEGYHGSYRCAIDKIGELSAERYIKVEQFAERLKGKFEHCVGDVYSVDTIDERIDETLKECIK